MRTRIFKREPPAVLEWFAWDTNSGNLESACMWLEGRSGIEEGEQYLLVEFDAVPTRVRVVSVRHAKLRLETI